MSFLNAPLSFLGIGNTRMIDDIDGFIVINETTRDELEITQQPIQSGASITDHSFLKPTVFSTQIQFTPGFLAGALTGFSGGLFGGAFGSTLTELYQNLLDLQSSREPFKITTPKRVYESMLFQSLSQTTDAKTENVLSISASFQQIIIVEVQSGFIPKINQKLPQVTGGIGKVGKKSALATLKSGIGAAFK